MYWGRLGSFATYMVVQCWVTGCTDDRLHTVHRARRAVTCAGPPNNTLCAMCRSASNASQFCAVDCTKPHYVVMTDSALQCDMVLYYPRVFIHTLHHLLHQLLHHTSLRTSPHLAPHPSRLTGRAALFSFISREFSVSITVTSQQGCQQRI